MKKEKLLEKLAKIKERMDSDAEEDTYYYEEDAHIDADELLLEFINDEEILEAFESIPKWYS